MQIDMFLVSSNFLCSQQPFQRLFTGRSALHCCCDSFTGGGSVCLRLVLRGGHFWMCHCRLDGSDDTVNYGRWMDAAMFGRKSLFVVWLWLGMDGSRWAWLLGKLSRNLGAQGKRKIQKANTHFGHVYRTSSKPMPIPEEWFLPSLKLT